MKLWLRIGISENMGSYEEWSLPNTAKQWHTAENNQELVNIFEHWIYSFYINLS